MYMQQRARHLTSLLVGFSFFASSLAGLAQGNAPAPAAPAQPTPPTVKRVKLDDQRIIKELTDFTVKGEDRRLGPDYNYYHNAGTRLPQLEQPEQFPEIYLAPKIQGPVKNRPYQLGSWKWERDDYSSTQGQIIYLHDKPDALGVDRVTILEMAQNTYTESPEPPWHGGVGTEPQAKGWVTPAGEKPAIPVAIARGMGPWSNSDVIVFSNNMVVTAGTVTATGSNPVIQLPKEKVPIAIAVTPRNEFTLITVYDKVLKKGQLCVIAMESFNKGFVHEWGTPHFGLVNLAVFSRMKILGYIDLPGITYPTGVCAVGDTQNPRCNGRDGNAGKLSEYDLANQNDRNVFFSGGNSSFVNRAGFAVVIGKYDQRAAFIDLQPLYQRMREMYMTTEENYQKTLDVGMEPNKWPFAFSVDPTLQPPIIKVIDYPTPTAVIASMESKGRVLIASRSGQVGIYSVGGLSTTAPANPDEIIYHGNVVVGHNPVCLAYQKYTNDYFIAVSRGDREISWIEVKGTTAKVVRRMRDKRLIDPVFTEMADTHGTDTSLLTVTDFKGRKILNYRWSPVRFSTNGGAVFNMGPDGKDKFECGGIMEFQGYPFAMSATNVN